MFYKNSEKRVYLNKTYINITGNLEITCKTLLRKALEDERV